MAYQPLPGKGENDGCENCGQAGCDGSCEED
jgi:hypothetical protein